MIFAADLRRAARVGPLPSCVAAPPTLHQRRPRPMYIPLLCCFLLPTHAISTPDRLQQLRVTLSSGRAKAAAGTALCAATATSLACGGAPKAPLVLGSLGASVACTLPGLADAHLAYSYGYGSALVCQSALASASLPASGSWARLLLCAYWAYGVKVCLFQAARDVRPDYVAKALLAPQAQGRRSPARLKLHVCLAVGLLLSAFIFPLSSAAGASGAVREAAAAAGAALALSGLALQTVADAQKYRWKARHGADALVSHGLWSVSRHPNFAGEMVFHVGVMLAGIAGATSAAAALLSALAPSAFLGVMRGATRRLEERQLLFFERAPPELRDRWRAYVQSTPRLFPLPAAVQPRADPIVAEVEERQEQETRGDEIAGILGITAGAGAVTAAVGLIGWLLVS
uniref:Steroid 5-alpha reductase C-terminal domain-containing protein n=1 Tax=Emiliania huxleyi TaxID=2903 RepID=A0A7S3WM13_EMIHU